MRLPSHAPKQTSHRSGVRRFRVFPQSVSLALVCGVFLASVAAVALALLAAAWVLGGRVVAGPDNVDEILPAEPPEAPSTLGPQFIQVDESPSSQADQGADVVSLMPPGRLTEGNVQLPAESLHQLKELGWVLPYLVQQGAEVDFMQTSADSGERTVLAQLSVGGQEVTVAETRAEATDQRLQPLAERTAGFADRDGVTTERLKLSTGEESTLFRHVETDSWSTAVETDGAQYIISAEMPSAAASSVSSWVLNADRSRVQLLPSSPDNGDRLERGIDELRSLVSR